MATSVIYLFMVTLMMSILEMNCSLTTRKDPRPHRFWMLMYALAAAFFLDQMRVGA